jgi:integrase
MKTPIEFPIKNPDSFPFKAGRSNATATMYRVNDRDYEVFKIPFQDNGQRKFHSFPNYEAARDKGNEMLAQLVRGDGDAVTLTASDKFVYGRAVEALRPLGLRLDEAVSQFVEAVGAMNGVSASLVEAARFYAKKNPGKLPPKPVPDAVDEFIKAKTDAKRSGRHIEDLSYRLGRFKLRFTGEISRVCEPELRTFFDDLDLSPRSKNNFRATVGSFFLWAKKKKYLPSDWDELSTIETVEDGEGEIEIFTPEEISKLLTHADAPLVPFLAIGAFAGLRSSEICRLDWEQIGVGGGKFIEVKASNARKTKQRRLVPIHANLKAWLQPYAKIHGTVWPHSHAYLYEMLEQVTASSKVKWKDNGLRHSFISYRVAETEDVAKVSLEAGNSPQMIFRNYRELVTPKAAKRWFSIKPGTQANVIQIKAA